MSKLSLEDLGQTLELLKTGNIKAFDMMDVHFRRRIMIQLHGSGIHRRDFKKLFQEILLGVWISAHHIDTVESLIQGIDKVTCKTIRGHIASEWSNRRMAVEGQKNLLSLLDKVLQNSVSERNQEEIEKFLMGIHPSVMNEPISTQ